MTDDTNRLLALCYRLGISSDTKVFLLSWQIPLLEKIVDRQDELESRLSHLENPNK